MTWLLSMPAIVKILGSLVVILILNSVWRRLALSLAGGILLLAGWSGRSWSEGLQVVQDSLSSVNNLLLIFIIFQVVWLSSQMAATAVMRDLVGVVRSRLSQRAAMAVLPAIIGALPMPGGALFSAPLVGDCDHDNTVDPVLKAQINYWFRHIWEYWWPLYPGVLLAVEIMRLDIWQFMLVNLPLSVAAVGAGYWFLLRRIESDPGVGGRLSSIFGRQFCRLIAPILTTIAVYAFVRVALPRVAALSKFLPMVIGIFAAMLVLQHQRPLPWRQWRRFLVTKRLLGLAVLVALVRIYGALIEAPLDSGPSMVAQMRVELGDWGIPVLAVLMLIPLISGMATGLAVGFVGASFPIVLSLLGEAPSLGTVLSTTVLVYGFGYTGMILSPVHVCLIVTNEHFSTPVPRALAGLVWPCVVVLCATVALYGVVAGLAALLP